MSSITHENNSTTKRQGTRKKKKLKKQPTAVVEHAGPNAIPGTSLRASKSIVSELESTMPTPH